MQERTQALAQACTTKKVYEKLSRIYAAKVNSKKSLHILSSSDKFQQILIVSFNYNLSHIRQRIVNYCSAPGELSETFNWLRWLLYIWKRIAPRYKPRQISMENYKLFPTFDKSITNTFAPPVSISPIIIPTKTFPRITDVTKFITDSIPPSAT